MKKVLSGLSITPWLHLHREPVGLAGTGRRDGPPGQAQQAYGSADVQGCVFAYMIIRASVHMFADIVWKPKSGVHVCWGWGWDLHAEPTVHERGAEQMTPLKRHDVRASLPFFKISATVIVHSSSESHFFEEMFSLP